MLEIRDRISARRPGRGRCYAGPGYRGVCLPGIPLRYPGYPCTPGTPPPSAVPAARTAGTAPPLAAVQNTRAPARFLEKAIAASAPLQSHAGACDLATCRDPVWMPVAGHPDSQPRGVPLVDQGVTQLRRVPRVTSWQSGQSAGPPPRIWGSGGLGFTGIPWRGVHELAIGHSGALQRLSGESRKYLLLCSLDPRVKVISTGNRRSRDRLQIWPGGPDPMSTAIGLGPSSPKTSNRCPRGHLQIWPGGQIPNELQLRILAIRPESGQNTTCNRTSRDVLQGQFWGTGPLAIALLIGSGRRLSTLQSRPSAAAPTTGWGRS